MVAQPWNILKTTERYTFKQNFVGRELHLKKILHRLTQKPFQVVIKEKLDRWARARYTLFSFIQVMRIYWKFSSPIMVKPRPKLQNTMAVGTYKNKAKGYVSQICASFCQNLSLSSHQKGDHGICVVPHDVIVKNCVLLAKKNSFASIQHKSLKWLFPNNKYRK